MLYKIREKATGKMFVKVVGNMRDYDPETHNRYLISEWVDQGGHIFDSEAAVNRTMKKLTSAMKPTKIRDYPVYPRYTEDDLEVVEVGIVIE